jgi:hypothetical protein
MYVIRVDGEAVCGVDDASSAYAYIDSLISSYSTDATVSAALAQDIFHSLRTRFRRPLY